MRKIMIRTDLYELKWATKINWLFGEIKHSFELLYNHVFFSLGENHEMINAKMSFIILVGKRFRFSDFVLLPWHGTLSDFYAAPCRYL